MRGEWNMNEEYSIIWKNFINLLKNRIALVSINSWFKNCKIYKIDDDIVENKAIKKITIETSSLYIKEALIRRYLETIEELMESILGKPCKIEFILTEEVNNLKNADLPKINDDKKIEIPEKIGTPKETNVENSMEEKQDNTSPDEGGLFSFFKRIFR